jgi:hypothetical protein
MTLELLCMALIAILFGLAVAFYRLFLVLLPIWGFFFGFGLGAQSITFLLGDAFLATVTGWIVGFVVGVIFAVLSYLFYIVGVALFSGSFGYALGIAIMGAIGLSGILAWVVGIILGIVVAAVVLIFNIQKYAIELITAAGGGAVSIAGLLAPFGVYTATDLASGGVIKTVVSSSAIWLILWIVLVVVAFFFQERTNRQFELEVQESNW